MQVQARTRASDNGGYGALTSPLLHTTAQGVPGVAGDIVFRDRNTSCLYFEWTPTSSPNGVIQDYQVAYDVISYLIGILL